MENIEKYDLIVNGKLVLESLIKIQALQIGFARTFLKSENELQEYEEHCKNAISEIVRDLYVDHGSTDFNFLFNK